MENKHKKVMGFGAFDILHPGHLYYLQELRKLGDFLIVVIARDTSITQFKKTPPVHSEKERLEAVLKTGIPNQAVLGSEVDFYKVLTDHMPDIIGLGYDQQADIAEILRRRRGLEIVRFAPFDPEKYKSSILRQQQEQKQTK